MQRYIMQVDRICPQCNFRNRTKIVDIAPIEIVACGKCGNIFMKPDDLNEIELKIIKKTIKMRLKKNNAIL